MPAHPRITMTAVVARDHFGVPHVFGRTDADVAYGVGYAHSEDDFATLQEVLAMARGRLGAMTGGDGAKIDYAVHLLGAQATVARDYDRQPADVRALLDGYASGLNAYAARHSGEVRLARLFPLDGRDVATGFVVRSPFFFGLDKVLGALSTNTPLPPESEGPAPDSPDPDRDSAQRRRQPERIERVCGRPVAIGGRLHPARLQFAPALGAGRRRGTNWWCIPARAGISRARPFPGCRSRCWGTTGRWGGRTRSTGPT